MFLDEVLVKEELKKRVKPDNHEEKERMIAEIRYEEENQKSVTEFITELKAGLVVIDGIEYRCEREHPFYVFPDDIENSFRNEQSAAVSYKSLEMGVNVMNLSGKLIIKDAREYQMQMTKHFRQSGMPYYPVDTGSLQSGSTTIHYATAITTSPIGGIYAVHFFYKTKGGFVSGSFTCKLLKRFSFEHLFMAMLYLFCEEENR